MAVLEIIGLSKNYGSFRALDDLHLQVAPGEVVGLLGPNGSGKTTALRLVLGFIKPTAGHARVCNLDCWEQSVEVRKRVSYLPGELRLYENMTGRQLVNFLGKLRGERLGPEVDSLARKLDIDPDKPLTHMSSGMKRKVALLAILLPKVPLVILDEPTNTLDPTMRDELIDQLRIARDAGKAVLFSSHVLQEVEQVCNRVAILRRGQLVHLQEMHELKVGRHVTAKLLGTHPTQGPDGTPLPEGATQDGYLDFDFRGSQSDLLKWLSQLSLEELKIGPLGLTPIYKKYHAVVEMHREGV